MALTLAVLLYMQLLCHLRQEFRREGEGRHLDADKCFCDLAVSVESSILSSLSRYHTDNISIQERCQFFFNLKT